MTPVLYLLFAAHWALLLPGNQVESHHTKSQFRSWDYCMEYISRSSPNQHILLAICEPFTKDKEFPE